MLYIRPLSIRKLCIEEDVLTKASGEMPRQGIAEKEGNDLHSI